MKRFKGQRHDEKYLMIYLAVMDTIGDLRCILGPPELKRIIRRTLFKVLFPKVLSLAGLFAMSLVVEKRHATATIDWLVE